MYVFVVFIDGGKIKIFVGKSYFYRLSVKKIVIILVKIIFGFCYFF